MSAATQHLLKDADNKYIPQVYDAVNDVFRALAGDASGILSSSPLPATTCSAPAAIGDSTTVVTLLAANAARLGATIYNDSTSILRVKLGASASLTSFHAVLAGKSGTTPGGYYEVPARFTGIVTGIWDTDAGGSAYVGEVSA